MAHSLPAQQELPHRKIAVLGSAPSLVAVPRDGWEYWSLMSNFSNSDLPITPNRWFELHSPEHLMNNAQVPKCDIDYMGNMENIWMMNPVGKAHQFPREDVLALTPYFTSSIAWVLGLAILQNPHSIGLWGVDLMLTKEYQRERPCIEHWVGFARARGIKVEIPEISPLCKGALYCDEFAYELQLRAKDNSEAIEKAKYKVAYLEGERDCIEAIRYTKG